MEEDTEPDSNLNNYQDSGTYDISKEIPLNGLVKTKGKLIKAKKRLKFKRKLRKITLRKQTNPTYLRKRILLSPNENQYIPPQGLKTDSGFQRLGILNPAVVQDEDNPDLITLFPRLIYQDSKGINSCITKQEALLQGYEVKMLEGEETIFQAKSPHGKKGVEDFRTIKLQGEDPLHGFLVYYNGCDSRTGYVRTSEKNPKDYSRWEEFGIFFPNIKLNKAISIVKQEKYKKLWEKDYKETTEYIKDKKDFKKNSLFLKLKDCCLVPKKIIREDLKGDSYGYYGIITRFFPDMQIIYIKNFEELASKEFWHNTTKNLGDFVLLERKYDWEKSHIGLAGAPLLLKEGIFLKYHGANMNPIRDYKTGAALLDKDNPQKVLARTKKPIKYATESWEKNGVVDGNVVFDTADAISSEGIIHEFYGAGDKYVGHCTTTKDKLLEHLFN